jgi:LPS export ABC transporter protein LptC
MRTWSRPLGFVAAIVIVAGAYYIGRAGRGDDDAELAAVAAPDPGYAARDAVIIETGYDGRERYRLKARVIHQQLDASVIDLEHLEMDYHPGAQSRVPGEAPASAAAASEIWHLTSDHGRVRANGDDVLLTGNVVVTGTTPGGGGEPMTFSTRSMTINTPTEFIETRDPVSVRWSGHQLDGVGMKADLKAGTLRLESDVHGEFSPR